MGIKKDAMAYDLWKAAFEDALDRVRKAEQSTGLAHDFDKKHWEDLVIRYRLWLVKTLQQPTEA